MQTKSENITSNVPPTEVPSVETIKEVGKFTGAFQRFGSNFYHTLVSYGIGKVPAHKTALDAMSALGQAMAEGDSELAAAVGKANKQGDCKLTIKGKSGTVTRSTPLAIIRICQLMDKMHDEKLIVARPNLSQNKRIFKEEHAKYLTDAGQQWLADVETK